MRKKSIWKRVLALGMAAVVALADQTIVYGAEAADQISDVLEEITEPVQFPENTEEEGQFPENTEEEGQFPENTEGEEQSPEITGGEEQPSGITEGAEPSPESTEETEQPLKENEMFTFQEIWNPKKAEDVFEEEKFVFEQPLIGRTEEEFYTYDTSYGKQITDVLASEFYEKLNSGEDSFEILLGTFVTGGAEPEGESYEKFSGDWKKAVQNAWDAWYFDCAEAGRLDVSGCELLVTFSGEREEEGTVQWTASGQWNLKERENLPQEEIWQEEMSVQQAYEEVQKLRQEEIQKAEEDERYESLFSDEDYARMFRLLCGKDAECILVSGIVEGKTAVWNLVRMEDDKWYAVDIVREIYLAGNGRGEESEAEHRMYGDFSNSHMGMFALPQVSDEDYEPVPAELPEELLPGSLPAEENMGPSGDEAEPAGETEEPIVESMTEPVSEEPELEAAPFKEIPPAEKTLAGISVSNVKPQTYSGKAITPKVKVKDNATGKTLKQGKQYSVSYENNVDAGTAAIVIRGIPAAGYDGVFRVNFTIQPQNIAKKVRTKISGKYSYTGSPITPGVTLTYNKMGLVQGRDYQISYSDNTAKGTARIHISGLGNYSGSRIVKFKISARKMKEAGISLSAYSAVYSGSNAYPTVTVTYGGKTCRQDVDYRVKYPKTLKAGKNSITVSGLNSFSGSVRLNYYINKAPMEEVKVSIPYAWRYTRKNIKVIPSSVKIGETVLKYNKDYKIRYRASNGKTSGSVKKEGVYQLLLTGKGSFQGTKVLDFCITSDENVLNNNYDAGADKNTVTPEPPENNEPPVPDTVYPENKVPAEKDRYFGYYEGNKISSKKGIQGVSAAYTEELAVQHVLLNVDMADMISTTERSGYVPYTYQGKTYYFSDLVALKKTIYDLHGWGSTEGNVYGENHMRTVTLVLLMSWKDELSYLIHPAARKKGAAPYYALNMQDADARATYEALFRYMGEWLGQYKTRVSNWTLGNEVNSCREWNYSGNLSLAECVANYARAFQLLYQGVTRTASSSRVFISLDHCWTASAAGHSGKEFLDQFAAYMDQTAPNMRWNVNYHPYSQPLSRRDFWNDGSNTTDSVSTKYISMKNIQVLTDYLSLLEQKYGKSSGSIRVVIGELGYSASYGNVSAERQQAAALGYGYYIAMFNRRIDSYIIRAYQDAAEEGPLYLGLRNRKDMKKESYDVYRYLDSDQSLTYMDPYLQEIGIPGWESAIPGFNAGDLPAVDF